MTVRFFLLLFFLFTEIGITAQMSNSFKDARDGNQYRTVKIGTQVWMAENLKFKADKGCYAYEGDESTPKVYGFLYTWDTARKVCPDGWHLPDHEEWNILINNLGGEKNAAAKLKEAGIQHWLMAMAGVTNESGFTALPGGYRNASGEFYVLGYLGWWWCSDDYDQDRAYHLLLYGNTNGLALSYVDKKSGFSVRCVKE